MPGRRARIAGAEGVSSLSQQVRLDRQSVLELERSQGHSQVSEIRAAA